ncbi:MAG TPA: hypothetical protein VJU87_04115 [Gemmatimonadaceae bacterium]|nr:hypothetical protein [Gemmatimonadaceae bacterium]
MPCSLRTLLALAALGASALACSHSGPELNPERVVNARVAPSSSVAYGDCATARRLAAAQPDLQVDRIPAPVKMSPRPLRGVPAAALRSDGSAEVKADVIVDTLGRADMRTFKVVSASHPWLASNVRSVIGKWRFTPALLAGCKVPRVYHFMAIKH